MTLKTQSLTLPALFGSCHGMEMSGIKCENCFEGKQMTTGSEIPYRSLVVDKLSQLEHRIR